jgi:hypothetical protein
MDDRWRTGRLIAPYTTGIGTLTNYTTDHWPTDMPSYLIDGRCGGITEINCHAS